MTDDEGLNSIILIRDSLSTYTQIIMGRKNGTNCATSHSIS